MMIYRIGEGDTLPAVARRHGVLPTALGEDNGLTVDSPLVAGQALLIRTPGEVYHVREGDTLLTVARRHRTTPTRLRQWNPALAKDPTLYEGMSLTVASAEPPRGALTVLGYAHAATPCEELAPLLPYLSYLGIMECRLTDDGALLPPEDGAVIAAAREAGAVPLLVVSVVGEGGLPGEGMRRRLLTSRGEGDALLRELILLVRRRGYGGLLLDLGAVPAEEAPAVARLIGLLRRALGHTATVALTLPPFGEGDREGIHTLGRAAGLLVAEAYAFSSRFGQAAPPAPYDRVHELAKETSALVRPSKLLLGLTARGADFPVGGGVGRYLPPAAQQPLFARGTVSYDPVGRVPYLSYREEEQERLLFFEDAESMREKLLLVDSLGIGGVALFPLVGTAPTLLLLLAELFRIVKPHGE